MSDFEHTSRPESLLTSVCTSWQVKLHTQLVQTIVLVVIWSMRSSMTFPAYESTLTARIHICSCYLHDSSRSSKASWLWVQVCLFHLRCRVVHAIGLAFRHPPRCRLRFITPVEPEFPVDKSIGSTCRIWACQLLQWFHLESSIS